MANFFDAKTNRSISAVQIAQGETFVLGLYGGSGKDRGFSDLFVSSTNPTAVSCDVVKKLKRDKPAYYNQHNVALIDTVEVRKTNLRYFQLLGLAEGDAQIQATLDPVGNASNQYSEQVAVHVTKNDRSLILGQLFLTLWSNHPGEEKPCDVQGLAGQCAIKMGVMLKSSGVSLAGLVGKKCWGKGAEHDTHFLDPNDIGRWLAGKGRPYVWSATTLAPEPMPGVAARRFSITSTSGTWTSRKMAMTLTSSAPERFSSGKSNESVLGIRAELRSADSLFQFGCADPAAAWSAVVLFE
jgi:hypothetical protein